jgi:hypothetical protein
MTDTIMLTELDPLNGFRYYRDPVQEALGRHDVFFVDNIGWIPDFIYRALLAPAVPLAVSMLEAYQFPLSPMTGGDVHDDGRYTYPEDPDLLPLAKITTARGIVYIYEFGIVAICETGLDCVVYRFD